MSEKDSQSQSEPADAPWRALVLTLFPEMFPGPLGISLSGQALASGIWSLEARDIRDHGLGRHRQVDDTPAGGGAGMVIRPDVLGAAIDAALARSAFNCRMPLGPGPEGPATGAGPQKFPLIYLSPRGEPFTQDLAREFAAGPGVILVAGRFEGVDERVIAARGMREISIGDYVLSGGELGAMVMLDACVRLLPGVLGGADTLVEESFDDGLLEYPQYTKPREWEGLGTPDILLSGDHGKIAKWRREQSLRVTAERRPDLMAKRRGR